MSPKPDYDDINRLERELFPEWFPDEPKPPPTPPPPPKRRRAPGREEEFLLEPGAVWPVHASAASVAPANFTQVYPGMPLKRATIYDRFGRPL